VEEIMKEMTGKIGTQKEERGKDPLQSFSCSTMQYAARLIGTRVRLHTLVGPPHWLSFLADQCSRPQLDMDWIYPWIGLDWIGMGL